MNKLFLLSIVLPEPALLTHISALPSIPCFDFCAVVLPPRMNFLFEPIRESFCENSLSVCLPAFLPISRVDIAQHTSAYTHNCISYSNTPNTGCPVLGVHIILQLCVFMFSLLLSPDYAVFLLRTTNTATVTPIPRAIKPMIIQTQAFVESLAAIVNRVVASPLAERMVSVCSPSASVSR